MMKTVHKLKKSSRSQGYSVHFTAVAKATGQSMVEYVVVVSTLMVILVGSHSAWEAVNSNRAGMVDQDVSARDVNARQYGGGTIPVTNSEGDVNANAISFRDGLNLKRDKMRDTLSELAF